MKISIRLFLLLILSLSLTHTRAQNLVKNGSFEEHHPFGTGGMLLLEDFVKNWSSYFTTPDYYSTEYWTTQLMLDYCGTLPRTGTGMLGGYELGYFPDMKVYNREYIQGELTEPLKAGGYYYGEIYVKPMRKPSSLVWGIKNIGFALTGSHYTSYDSIPDMMIPEAPEVEWITNVLTDMANWTKVSGCFKAQGGETSIIIGNFKKDEETDKVLLPGSTNNGEFSYYLFDDMLVKELIPPAVTPSDTIICKDSIVTLTAYSPSALSYHWNTGATTPEIQVSAAGTYTVTITTEAGCTLEGSATVANIFCGTVCPLPLLPDAFSPNNDGRNDLFRILNPIDIHSADLSVYNRWGERIYYTSHAEEGWDGTNRGKMCDIGSYFYVLRYSDCHQGPLVMKKGTISLIR
jgi:gliding motility-associated-like protein